MDENRTFLIDNIKSAVPRLTAMWAFSEAAFGGILHAFHIPLTGLFIGGSAVIFLSLIAFISESRNSIIKATIIVIVVKGIIAPHTPVNAYLSVLIQGLLAYVLFFSKKYFFASALTLGIVTLLFFAFQKLLVYTIIFGSSFWEAIDVYASYIIKQFIDVENRDPINFSYWLISGYVLLHLIGGIFFGIVSAKSPVWLRRLVLEFGAKAGRIETVEPGLSFKRTKLSKRKFRNAAFVLFAVFLIGVSYFSPELGPEKANQILLMGFRSILILLLWYSLAAPVMIKILKRFSEKSQSRYSSEVREIITVFPHFKSLINTSWNRSLNFKGLKKIKSFLSYSFFLLLITDFNAQ